MHTTNLIKVYISDRIGSWVLLNGYAGGLNLGVTVETVQREGDSDGMTRFFKGNRAGAQSQIAVYTIEGDPGQELARFLAGDDSDGFGSIKIELPQGGSIAAEGLFHGVTRNPFDPDNYQGFLFNFTQNEPESEG